MKVARSASTRRAVVSTAISDWKVGSGAAAEPNLALTVAATRETPESPLQRGRAAAERARSGWQ
eukprot:2464550-Pleurochrysis_carterae.AAC.2